MKVHPDIQVLLQTLKRVMKAKKYTYRRLGEEIGTSEVTVKRFFSGRGCSLSRITAICECLGTSILDVASLAKADEEVDYFLTREQEAFFASAPGVFGIFKELYSGRSPHEVAKAWRLSSTRLYRLLRALEKQQLLDVLPGDRVRFKIRGVIRMTHRGPLAKKLLRPQVISFLDHVDETLENDDVCMHSAEVELSRASIAELVEEIHALGAKYRARAFRDKSVVAQDQLSFVRWLLAFAPYKTDWRQYGIPER